MRELLNSIVLASALLLMSACASDTRVQSNFDQSMDFSQYNTYNFHNKTEIENPEFDSVVGLTFSAAVEQQLLSRGYTRSDQADILIDVSIDVEDKSRAPTPSHGCPSYSSNNSAFISTSVIAGQRRGTYCQYTEGPVKIEMVDAKLKRTIWEGTSIVRIDERERGILLSAFIVRDVEAMFADSPFNARQPHVWYVESNRVVKNED
jgi:hypothetical protein